MSIGRSDITATAHAQTRLAANVRLRLFCVTLGLGWAVLFPIVGLRYSLQLFGDGSLFSYALAVQEAWAFHWHNISGRLFVYLYAHAPAEAYVALTGNVHGALALHGLLFFSAPALGLFATFAFDRSAKRTLFVFACVSTALVLPFVFGFPTEMWMAHALFWPTLAFALDADDTWSAWLVTAALFTALVLTHGGGVVLAFVILAVLFLRGHKDVHLLRAAKALAVALVIWAFALASFRPDAYISGAIEGAAFNFINLHNLDLPITRLLVAGLASYAALYWGGRRLGLANTHLMAAVLVAVGLVAYWMFFDRCMLSEMRYPLRTTILFVAPALGMLAAAYTLSERGAIVILAAPIARALDVLRAIAHPNFLVGALMLVTLVHAVETAKFTSGWSSYLLGLRNLAMSSAADPTLGNPRFVSSVRLGTHRNQFAWGSTTHFLSVLVAPNFKPERLVVDPDTNYFWLSCATATANMVARRQVPAESRQLVRTHACLHR